MRFLLRLVLAAFFPFLAILEGCGCVGFKTEESCNSNLVVTVSIHEVVSNMCKEKAMYIGGARSISSRGPRM